MFLRQLHRFVILSVILLSSITLTAQDPSAILLKDHCATPEEVALYDLIAAFRKEKNLPPVPFSKSLSYVARVHLMDLTAHRPDFAGCNPHSWSDKGKWKSCCYSRDEKRIACMTEKPKELTNYKAKAWEIIYEAGEPAVAADAFDLWKEISLTRDYFSNEGKWAKPWKAIGIAVYGDYASVWFGEGDDPEKIYTLCGSDSAFNQPMLPEVVQTKQEAVQPKDIPAEPLTNYAIITGSLNSLEKANREVARLRDLGYSKARLIPSGNNFRISISEYPTEAEASKNLRDFQTIYPGAWILKPDKQ